MQADVEQSNRQLESIGRSSASVADSALGTLKRQDVELRLRQAQTDLTLLKDDARILGKDADYLRRLAAKEKDIVALKDQLQREFPESSSAAGQKRWWRFWR